MKPERIGRAWGIRSDTQALLAKDPEARFYYEQRRLVHEVALALRAMREEADLTQVELAQLIGTTQSAIARIEKGTDQRTPRWDTLNRIAIALGKELTLVFSRPSRKHQPHRLVEVKDAQAAQR
jgi:DNA-binding XRE family transcriptional regulator